MVGGPSGKAQDRSRPQPEVERFFDGLELVPPGVVQVGAWQQGGAPAAEPGPITANYVGVGRKP